ncbi:head-tail adaptor [Loktanella ponticola]|uniref:Head-tail adaptor n=1 Tax=Yoonia ponticola TaxID=1524255 RepID=A0A7W9EYW8_9RHOB|nr:head-tail adaptor protein [Yoonia ponticola]MBB5723202.1 head-tail adaptor [Yoonia ponticola]
MTLIKAGALREQVTFERKVETVQPSGAVLVQWMQGKTLRAELVQESAETFLSGTEHTEDRKVFRLWACKWINTDLRLIHADRTYRIAKIVPLDRLGLELHCINAVNEVHS